MYIEINGPVSLYPLMNYSSKKSCSTDFTNFKTKKHSFLILLSLWCWKSVCHTCTRWHQVQVSRMPGRWTSQILRSLQWHWMTVVGQWRLVELFEKNTRMWADYITSALCKYSLHFQRKEIASFYLTCHLKCFNSLGNFTTFFKSLSRFSLKAMRYLFTNHQQIFRNDGSWHHVR